MELLPATSSSSVAALIEVAEPSAARSRSEERKREGENNMMRGGEGEREKGDKDDDLRKFEVLRGKRESR